MLPISDRSGVRLCLFQPALTLLRRQIRASINPHGSTSAGEGNLPARSFRRLCGGVFLAQLGSWSCSSRSGKRQAAVALSRQLYPTLWRLLNRAVGRSVGSVLDRK
jgi:hypothetical protein